MRKTDEGHAKPRLFIIQRKQFGYHTDSLKIARILADSFNITFLCFDATYKHIDSDDIQVHYISARGGFIRRATRFMHASIKELRAHRTAHVFVVYFPLCSLIPLTCSNRLILDIRTSRISPNPFLRTVFNALLKTEAKLFSRISIISDGLRRHLGIPAEKTFILPLGADVISCRNKLFDVPRLFYIGTFTNRRLEDVLHGLAIFLDRNTDFREKLRFSIVGYGWNNEESTLRKLIARLNLRNNVDIHGRLTHDEARPFFDHCNIGISYVPQTSYFDHQPPTKAYEYILSGMPIIATSTSEHLNIVNRSNGVLCSDTPESFARALEVCLFRFQEYKSSTIRATLSNGAWENIAARLRKEIAYAG